MRWDNERYILSRCWNRSYKNGNLLKKTKTTYYWRATLNKTGSYSWYVDIYMESISIFSQNTCMNKKWIIHVIYLLHTWLLKKCVDNVLPLKPAITNKSMDETVIPLCLKRTTITLLIKRYGWDLEDMKNNRPISNLLFISMFIEREVGTVYPFFKNK